MQGVGCRIYQDLPWCRVQGKGFWVPLALRAESNRLFQVLDLFWRSLDSGDLWYKFRVHGRGFRVKGLRGYGLTVQSLEIRVWGLRSRV